MKIVDGFALREVAGEQVLMPTGENIAKFEGAIVLNEVAAFAYRKLQEYPNGLDIKEIAAFISENYEIDTATAEADIAEVLNQLIGYGVIEK